MKRIKDISKVFVAEGFVLLKVNLKNSLIVAPDMGDKQAPPPQLDYAEVIGIGVNTGGIGIGDIILSYNNGGAETYVVNDNTYSFVPKYNIKFYITKDNFNNGRKEIPLELTN